MTDLILFKDRDFKEPFTVEHLGNVKAGTTKVIEAYLKNMTDFDIQEINYEVVDKDVTIINSPNSLKAESWALVNIRYSPNALRMRGLNTYVTYTGDKVIPAE
jgi:hypothetical protein